MYFRVNMRIKKHTCCCFTWTVFIEFNFIVAFVTNENLGWLICK